MIGTNQYDLTWEHFEQLHKEKKNTFENLCRSLFVRELCYDGVILHSNHNHPGVEVEPVLAKDEKTRISFQAKHFDNVIKYKQIEDSANITINHYCDNLDVVYLYCNKDIDEKCDSFLKIKKMLTDNEIDLVLITGQTILDQAMNYPQILSRYFGLDSLDDYWFIQNVKLSLENLGKRYNSLFNIDTEAQQKLLLFLREDKGIETVNNKKRAFLSELKELKLLCNKKFAADIAVFEKWGLLIEDIDKNTLIYAIEWKKKLESDCAEQIGKLNIRLNAIEDKICKKLYGEHEYDELEKEKYDIERILSVSSYLDFSEAEVNIINSKIAIITGEMGTGKSQLLATTAKRRVEVGRPVLLFLGQTFITDDPIEIQIMHNLEGLSSGQTFESLVASMAESAKLIDEDAIIFIDAINESKNRDVWKNGINRIIKTLNKYSRVKLVVSLRTGYEKITLSQSVQEKIESGDIACIKHFGLIDKSPEKVYEFLSCYGIPFSPEYYLSSQMTNPLFLTWFCDNYNGEEQGLITLINNVLEHADYEGSKNIGLSEATGMLKMLLYEMLDILETGILTKQVVLGLNAWNTYGVNNKVQYLNAIERAGILTSYIRNQEELYYIGFNLLEDYLWASRIIKKEKSKENIINYCKTTLFAMDSEGVINNYGKESVFAMVVSIYSMEHGEELIELLDDVTDKYAKEQLTNFYYNSFIWRSSYITRKKFFEILNQYPVETQKLWDVFIENAVKEKSELNALGLTELLNSYSLSQRDYLWTMDINNFGDENRLVSLAYFIENGKALEGLTDEKAYLLSVTYTWMLSSSNRILRDRISKAMIEILKDHFSICKCLLELFNDVNDPYIIQRLYGIVFGAVMKRKNNNEKELETLAIWIYKKIFDKEKVYPDILLRDYARLIVERYIYENPDGVGEINIEKIRPPYKSQAIPDVEEVDYSIRDVYDKGLWPLLHSMKFDMNVNGVGMYGDFGRYVYQSALENFVDVDFANIYYCTKSLARRLAPVTINLPLL